MRAFLFLVLFSFMIPTSAKGQASRGGGPGNGAGGDHEIMAEISKIIGDPSFKPELAEYAEAYFNVIHLDHITEPKLKTIFKKMKNIEGNGKLAIVNDIWDSPLEPKKICKATVEFNGRTVIMSRDAETQPERGKPICFNLTTISMRGLRGRALMDFLRKLTFHEIAHHFGLKDKSEDHAIGYLFSSPLIPLKMEFFRTENDDVPTCQITDELPDHIDAPAQFLYVTVNGIPVKWFVDRRGKRKSTASILAAIELAEYYRKLVGCRMVGKKGASLELKENQENSRRSAVCRVEYFEDRPLVYGLTLDEMQVPVDGKKYFHSSPFVVEKLAREIQGKTGCRLENEVMGTGIDGFPQDAQGIIQKFPFDWPLYVTGRLENIWRYHDRIEWSKTPDFKDEKHLSERAGIAVYGDALMLLPPPLRARVGKRWPIIKPKNVPGSLDFESSRDTLSVESHHTIGKWEVVDAYRDLVWRIVSDPLLRSYVIKLGEEKRDALGFSYYPKTDFRTYELDGLYESVGAKDSSEQFNIRTAYLLAIQHVVFLRMIYEFGLWDTKIERVKPFTAGVRFVRTETYFRDKKEEFYDWGCTVESNYSSSLHYWTFFNVERPMRRAFLYYLAVPETKKWFAGDLGGYAATIVKNPTYIKKSVETGFIRFYREKYGDKK